MSRLLSDLTSPFQPVAQRLLDEWLAAHPGNPLIVTFTLRTQAEQDLAVAQGRSETHHGPHLAHTPDGKSWAMDVAPHSLIGLPNYAPADPLWWDLGNLAISLGLRWGGRWSRPISPPVGKVPDYLWDPGHIEYVAGGVHTGTTT